MDYDLNTLRGNSAVKTCSVRLSATLLFLLAIAAFGYIALGGLTLAYDLHGSTIEAAIPDLGSGVDAYIDFALQNSPRLHAARYEWLASIEEQAIAGTLPDPVLSYGYFVENIETRVGPQRHRIGLRQTVPWFGTLGARKGVKSKYANAASMKYEAEKLVLMSEVRTAYYDYFLLRRKCELISEHIDILALWEPIARTRYETGLDEYSELVSIRVEKRLLEIELQQIVDEAALAQTRLRLTTNLPASAVLPDPVPYSRPTDQLEVDSLIALALEMNYDLRAIQQVVEGAALSIESTRKDYMPNLTIGIDYIETAKARYANPPDNGKDSWLISASVSMPIWFGKNASKVKEAVALRKAKESKYAHSRNELAVVVERTASSYNDNMRRIKLYSEEIIPALESSLASLFASYEGGRIDIGQLLNAGQRLIDSRFELEEFRRNAAVRFAEIRMLTGSDITEDLSKPDWKGLDQK